MNKKNTPFSVYKKSTICLSLLLLMSSKLYAYDGERQKLTLDAPVISEKHYLPNSIYFYITQKGMSLFQNNIYQLIQQQGAFQLEENTFAPQSVKLPEMKTEDLAKTDEQKKLVQTVRNFLMQWLNGLTLTNTHQFVIEVGTSGYKAQFKKISLNGDEALLEALGKKDGAIFSLEIEAEKFAIASEKVRAFDYVNQNILPTVGFDGVSVSIKPSSTQERLKMKIPFYVQLDPKTGVLNIEVLKISENIKLFDIDVKYKKVVTSEYKIIIEKKDEGQSVKRTELSLNMQNFSDLLNENRSKILAGVKASIVEFVDEKLPQTLNEKAKEYFAKELSFTHDIPLQRPSRYDEVVKKSKPQLEVDPFIMGHKVVGLKQKNGISLHLSSFIEDLKNPRSVPDPRKTFKTAPTLEYVQGADAILVLNQSLIFRLMQLYKERGYFSHLGIGSCDGNPTDLSILGTPELTPLPDYKNTSDTETFLKVSTRLQVAAPQSVKFATKNGYVVVSGDAVLKVKKSYLTKKVRILSGGKMVEKEVQDKSETRVEIYLEEVLGDTVEVDTSSLSLIGKIGDLFGMVDSNVQPIVDSINHPDPKCGPATALLENIPIPPAIYGIKFDILKMKVDREGPLVMYLKYN